MIVSFIAAIGKNGEMGIEQKLPWHIKADFQNFKKITIHHHLLMGRKTFESIGIVKPLPERTSIVVTRDADYQVPAGHFRVHDIFSGIELAREQGEAELFVLGGGEIFKQLGEHFDKIYLSRVDYDGPADTFFPQIDWSKLHLQSEQNFEGFESTPAWKYQVWQRS